MRAFFRSKYYAAVVEAQNGLQYAGLRLFGANLWDTCADQSTCAKTAREIITLIERKQQDSPYQDSLVREEILALLNHEKLLTHYQCHALALLTLQEAARRLMLSPMPHTSQHLVFLQEIQIHLRQNYFDKPVPPRIYSWDEHARGSATSHAKADDEHPPILELLVPKHIGQGMKYLEALRKHTTTQQASAASTFSSSHHPAAHRPRQAT